MKVFNYAALLCSFTVLSIVTGLDSEAKTRNLRGLNQQLEIINVGERSLGVSCLGKSSRYYPFHDLINIFLF
jgi:hypothetical protein